MITQYSGNAFVSETHIGPTEISHNTFDAPLCTVEPADIIFFMTYGGNDVTTLQNVSYNTFNMGTASLKSTAISFSAPGPGGAQGNAKFTNVLINGNTFTGIKNNGRAIGFWNGCIGYPTPPEGPRNNIISPVVTNNHIYGVPGSVNSYGIFFYDDYGSTVGATIRYNTITGMAVGIYLRAGDAPSTIINYNNIYGNTLGVHWLLGSAAVDARYNWWGDLSGPSHTSNPGGIGDVITDKVDYSPWLGALFETTPRTYHVNPTGAPNAIQEAINEASPSDTIIIHEGSYDEQVVIDKSLTLQGSGVGTIVKPSSADKLATVLSGYYWGGTKQIAGIIVANTNGGNVIIKDITIDGENVATKPTSADYVAGIFYRETSGTIDSAIVDNMTIGATGTSVRGYGIYLSAITNNAFVEVKESTLTNFDKNGIDVHGSKLTVNIHNNTITGRGTLPFGDEVQNGIVIMDEAAGTVNTNTISNMAYEPQTWWSTGILFMDSSGSASNNIITDCQIGIIFNNGNGLVQNNTVTGGSVGLLGIWAQYDKEGTWTVTFMGNTISGASDSLDYENGAVGAQCWNEGAQITLTIDNNEIIGDGATSADGIYIGDIPEYGPAGSITATITNNIISGWQHGIRLVSSVTEATITGNTIKNNVGTSSGIHIEENIATENIHINYNNIFGNNITGTYGVFTSGAGTLDARYNWWGDPTGPYHPELNPSGKGDRISDHVIFEPWLLETYPPATPVGTLLYVNPSIVEYPTPSYGETFTVDIKVENVEDLFAYEFKLFWDTSLLDLVNTQVTPPWPNYFIGKEEINETLGSYWLGITAVGSYTFSGSTTLAKLTFKITYDPLYPDIKTCKLDLKDTILAGLFGSTIYHMTHDGTYRIYSVEPKMKVIPTPQEVNFIGSIIKVDIAIENIVDLYEFKFKLTYNTTMLDVTEVQVNFLGNPYLYQYAINETEGYVWIWAWSLLPAPPSNGTGTLAIITMKATAASIWPDPPLTCTLHLCETQLKTKEGAILQHSTEDSTYTYRPIIGDLNADGKVDLVDLRIIAYYYDPYYAQVADLNRDGKVNVIDLAIVASYYEE